MAKLHRDEVFTPGGQPSKTYVARGADVELNLARAIATPNQIVSLAGPTKTGKTVLCRRVLQDKEYVWVNGGQVTSGNDFWQRVATELNLPAETTKTDSDQANVTVSGGVPLTFTATGSHLRSGSVAEKRVVHNMSDAISQLVKNKIVLVVDDFHYMAPIVRTEVMRNVKGAVFEGLKVLLLSVTHRAFDAIKAETEMTGRFTAIMLPPWSLGDLKQIAALGFEALSIRYPEALVARLADEAQESPFLMQQFCWEICFDKGIEQAAGMFQEYEIEADYDPEKMFVRVAENAGLPIYQQLAAGPQVRKSRAKRPLRDGTEADIYQVTLLALAETGPKSVVTYEELRTAYGALLKDKIPQKHEVTSALKHLAMISKKIGAESAIDWEEQKREVNVADPYLRFYLRWRVKRPVTA